MSKGSKQRPGTGYAEGAERIWPEESKYCPGCGLLPSWCACTTDGPGQDEARDAAKLPYDPRRFNREGV